MTKMLQHHQIVRALQSRQLANREYLRDDEAEWFADDIMALVGVDLAPRSVELPDSIEEKAMVLHPGDIIMLRNKNRDISREEAEHVKLLFAERGVTAIVTTTDWEVVREPKDASV